MARLPYLDQADLAPADRDLLDRNINLFRAFAHSPGMARAFKGLGTHIRHGSRLDARLRELAILQVGYLARAPYEWSHHIRIGRDFGVSDDDIRGLIAESEGGDSSLEPVARTVLKAAREMTGEGALSDATYADLERALDAECLVDLLTTIAFYNGVVRLLAALQIDVEDDYLCYLEEFPLPDGAG